MTRGTFLPAIYSVFALLSLLVLQSIAPSLVVKQLVFFVIGGILIFLGGKVPYSFLEKLAPLGYLITCLLLVLTLVIAVQTRNTSRWFTVAGINVQPSQLAIPAVGLMVSTLAVRYKPKKIEHTIGLVGVIVIPAVLILVEPDLGTTLVFLASVGSALLYTGIRLRYLAFLGLIAVGAGLFVWSAVLQPWQKARLTSFRDQQDVSGASYNAQQSLIAVGAGQFIGRGLGQGSQSHLRFLPERQTDFIFASLAEEFGFLGSAIVLLMYAALFIYFVRISLSTSYESGKIISLIIATMFVLQVGVNVGMNIGLVPITGITLPLLSYGGSSLITTAAALALLQSLSRENVPSAQLHLS